VVWWPGIQNWRRSLALSFRVGWKRFNWDLHSAMGIWTSLFILMWGITGIYAALPAPFRAIVDYFDPPKDEFMGLRAGDRFLRTVSRIHWDVYGKKPGHRSDQGHLVCRGTGASHPVCSGVIMWWNSASEKTRGSDQ
jgi:hypothetical protein